MSNIKLDISGLSLSEDPAPPTAAIPTDAAKGYSPYDSGILVKSTGTSAGGKKDLRRLSEWLKLRSQIERTKKR